MFAQLLPFAVAAFSVFFYHILQKVTPTHVNPVIALALTYFTACLSSLALLPLFPNKSSLVIEIRALTWHSVALGFSVLGIELGFLLAYRSGWQPGRAALGINTIAALTLLIASALFFGQSVTLKQVVGIVTCLVGLWLLMSEGS